MREVGKSEVHRHFDTGRASAHLVRGSQGGHRNIGKTNNIFSHLYIHTFTDINTKTNTCSCGLCARSVHWTRSLLDDAYTIGDPNASTNRPRGTNISHTMYKRMACCKMSLEHGKLLLGRPVATFVSALNLFGLPARSHCRSTPGCRGTSIASGYPYCL